MRKNIELIAILMAVLAACLFTACDGGAMEELWKDELENGNVPVSERCTVTFVSNGGTEVASQTIEKGTCAVKPQDPTFGENTFIGWFLKGSSEKFNFSTPIAEDITLYAHWKGLVETKTKKQTLDVSSGGKIEVEVSPIPSQKTSVAIPEGALSGTGSHSSELAVTSYAIEVSTTTFQILNQSAQNNLAVAGIDCALKIDDEIVSDFNKPIIITTYIPKGLSSVEVIYNGDAAKSQPDAGGTAPNKNVAKIYNNTIGETNLGYDKATGLLRFSTDHFSEFYVATNAEVCIVKDSDSKDISAMKLGEFRDNVNNNNDYKGYTVTVLKDCDYTNEDWVPIGIGSSICFMGTFNGNNHKISIENETCPNDDMGLFDVILGWDYQAVVRNLTLNVNMITPAGTQSWVGGLCAGTCGNVLIENVSVNGFIQGGATAGGLIGWGANCYGYQDGITNETQVINCTNNATVKILANSKGWYIMGGIAAQTGGGTTKFINCVNNGQLLSDFTADPNGYVYAGHLAGKGEYKQDKHIYIDNFTIGPDANLKGYGVNGEKGENGYYQGFEGYDLEIGDFTYQGKPNFKKQCIGAYFGTCHFIGDDNVYTKEFPHGSAE